MLYTRRNKRKRRPNWGRILLTLLALLVIALSVYFLAAGLTRPRGTQQTEQESQALQTQTTTPEAPTPETPATQAPSQEPTPETPALTGQRRMTLGLTGNIASGDFLIKAARDGSGYDYAEMFARIEPYLQMQDCVIAPLGCGISDGDDLGASAAPTQLLDSLSAAGVDVLGLACERSLDQGVEGATETAGLLADSGLDCAGVYASGADYLHPLILEGQDLRVAVLSYTLTTDQTPDGARDVVKYLDDTTLQNDMNALAAEESPVDFVVAVVNWGSADSKDVSDEQKSWAQKLADAGVDVILGSHPTAMQPLEELQGKDGRKTLVAYSLGTLLAEQQAAGRETGAILNVTLVKDYDNGTAYYENVSYQPTWVLRYSIEGKYHFEIMPVNRFKNGAYENMGLEARARIAQVTDEIRSTLGESVGKLDESVLDAPQTGEGE